MATCFEQICQKLWMVKTGAEEMPCKWLCKHFLSKTSAAAVRLMSRVIMCSDGREKRFMSTQGYP